MNRKKFIRAVATVAFGAIVLCSGHARGSSEESAKEPPSYLTAVARQECVGFDELAAGYRERFFEPMRQWASEPSRGLGAKRVLYLFSGADIVTALALFGEADHFTLIALQRPTLSVADVASSDVVAQECATMSYFARFGYFRTADLEGPNTSTRPRFVKMLAYSAALAGAKLNSVTPLKLTQEGKVVRAPVALAEPDGLELALTSRDQRNVTVVYLRGDLSNNGLRRAGNGLYRLIQSEAGSTVFIKSAAHLLQYPPFTVLGQFIGASSAQVVQDETGLDIDQLNQSFSVESYWRDFDASHRLWEGSASVLRLRAFLRSKAPQPLPFVIGYDKPGGSVLLVGTRRPRG